MADLLQNKLLPPYTSTSSRFPLFSFPLTLSPHSNFSFVRFFPLKQTRRYHSPVIARVSPDAPQFDIISTIEHSDGTIVFKFGDASEIHESLETLDCSDAKTKIVETSHNEVGVVELEVNDVNSEDLELSSGDHKAAEKKSEVQSIDGDNDVKSDVVGTFDGDIDHELVLNDVRDIVEVSSDESDARIEKLEVQKITQSEPYETDEISVGVGTSGGEDDSRTDLMVEENVDGGDDASSEKSEVVLNSIGEHVATNAELEVLETSNGKGDAHADESKVVGTKIGEDVDENNAGMLESSNCELGMNDEDLEIVGTSFGEAKSEVLESSNGEHDVHDNNLKVVETSVGEIDIDDAKMDALESSNGKGDVIDEDNKANEISRGEVDAYDGKSEVLETPNGETDVSDEGLEVVGTSIGELDADGAKLEVLESLKGEHDILDLKVVEASITEVDTLGAKSEALKTSNGESDTHDEDLKVVRTSIGELNSADAKLEVHKSSYAEGDDHDEDLKVVGFSIGIVDANDTKSEVLEMSNGANDIHVENSKVVGTSVGEVDADDAKSEVLEVSNGASDIQETQKAVGTSVGELDAGDAGLEMLDTSRGASTFHDENMKFVGTLNSELDADGARLETLEGEGDASAATLEVLESLGGEHRVKFERETISDDFSKAEESGGTEMEHAVNGKPISEETAAEVEPIMQTEELVGSTSVTNETFTSSVVDSQYAAQSNGDNVVTEEEDSVELMSSPSLLESEPIIEGEPIPDSLDKSVALESVLGVNMGNGASASVIVQPDDDTERGDTLEAADLESEVISTETNTHSDKTMEISSDALSISSAAVALCHPSEALTGEDDAYFVSQNWFGVADGIGQWSLGGTNKGFYAQELMRNCEMLASNSKGSGLTNIKEVLQQSAAMTQSAGSARVLIAYFDDQVLHVANIGDSGFLIIRNGAVMKKSSSMVHEFNFPHSISSGVDPMEVAEEYHVELEDGDVVITATDGLFDNLYEQEIASIVSKSMVAGTELKDLAEILAVKAQEVGKSSSARTPFADTAQAAGHPGFIGGKLDHVTVIVSLVQSR